MSTPGLLWVNSGIKRPDLISAETYNKWYNETHIKDILSTSEMHTAIRYQNLDPSTAKQYLALYPVGNVDWLETDEFNNIPVKDEIFKSENKLCFEVADFDTRFYEHIHGFEKDGAKAGPANLIISAALTPASGTDSDFDRWYKEEHYGTLAECKGYIRTRRYRLKHAVTATTTVPKYLALHEFEGESLPAEDLKRSGATEWSKKIMGSLEGQEVKVFRLLGSWGDVKAKF